MTLRVTATPAGLLGFSRAQPLTDEVQRRGAELPPTSTKAADVQSAASPPSAATVC
jgi:hypothetical protein